MILRIIDLKFIMEKYSLKKRQQLIQLYYENSKSATVAIRQFCTANNIKRKDDAPHPSTILRLIEKFEKEGQLLDISHGGQNNKVANAEIIMKVKNTVEQFQNDGENASLRKIVSTGNVDLSIGSVRVILKDKLGWKAFKYPTWQELPPHCPALRVNFCKTIIHKRTSDPSFVKNILFTDECHVSLHGYVNKQNMRYWGLEKPTEHIIKSLHCPRTTVWFGISHNSTVGPFFFNDTIDGANYRQMITDLVIPELKRKRINNKIIYMQDGATAHTALATRDLLRESFANRLIGLHLEVPWPSHSPDLNPCDFFLWGYLKDNLFGSSKSYPSVDALEDKIRFILNNIDKQLLIDVIANFEVRVDKCFNANGFNFE
jgi:hypothetical protein